MNNLKNILYRLKFAYKAKASADEEELTPEVIQNIVGGRWGRWYDDPMVKDLGLWVADKFLQHHGPGSNTPIRLDRLNNDATIIFPDLDNPDVIEEYVEWVKGISTCYKNPGEGNATEVIFGYEGTKFWMCLNGLMIDASCAALERNEVPIPLPQGRDAVSGLLRSSSGIQASSPYTTDDFLGKSIAQIRAMICQMHFNLSDGKPWSQASEEEKQDARYSFVQYWLNAIVNHIESHFTGLKLKEMGYYNGPGVTSQNIVLQVLERGGIACVAVAQGIIASWVNLPPTIINSLEAFQYRRVRQLLRMQALMYFTLLLNSNVCNELSGEERVKCRCGIKKKPAPPPEPEPELEPGDEMELGPITPIPPQFGGPIGYRPVRRRE
jgi:hypothetical protein